MSDDLARVDIVFDGPPGPEGGRFVEVEDASGKSIRFGEWVHREDGYWVLRLSPPPLPPDVAGLVRRLRAPIGHYGQNSEDGGETYDQTRLEAANAVESLRAKLEAAERERDELKHDNAQLIAAAGEEAARADALETALREAIGAIEDCHAYRSHNHHETLRKCREALTPPA